MATNEDAAVEISLAHSEIAEKLPRKLCGTHQNVVGTTALSEIATKILRHASEIAQHPPVENACREGNFLNLRPHCRVAANENAAVAREPYAILLYRALHVAGAPCPRAT